MSRTEAHGVSWGKVRDIRNGRSAVTVYNLEVENDNSYVVENIIVHNCQNLSIAGARAGLQGDRSVMFFEMTRIIREMREATHGEYPKYVLWENVVGAFSSLGGEDFRTVIEEFCRICDDTISIPLPEKGKWLHAGEVLGDSYSFAYREFDAQYWGVPQRRKRIYAVLDTRGQRAGEILFVEKGLHRHSQAGGASGEGAPGHAPGSIGGGGGDGRFQQLFGESGQGYWDFGNGGCLTPWDHQSKRLYESSGQFPSLISGERSGQNQQGVCYPSDRGQAVACDLYNQDISPMQPSLGVNCGLSTGRNGVIFEPMSAMEENWAESQVKNALRADASKSSHAVVSEAFRNLSVLNDQGGGVILPEDGQVSPTLREQMKHHEPIVSYNKPEPLMLKERAGKPGGGKGALWGGKSFTLSTLQDQCLCMENPGEAQESGAWGVDCRNAVIDREITHTIQAKPDSGVSINCTPSVCYRNQPNGECYAIDQQGGKGGANYAEDVMPPLLSDSHGTPHGVCYAVDAYNQSMSKTTGAVRGAAACDTDHIGAVCYAVDSHQQDSRFRLCDDGVSPTLPGQMGTGGNNGPMVLQPAITCGNGQAHMAGHISVEKAGPLDCMHDAQIVVHPRNRRYIIRRLTPTECARLQGFPDSWGKLPTISGMDEKEAAFWRKEFGTPDAGVDALVRKYNKLYCDSKEYRMWGNGIALPNAAYVVGNVARELRKGEEADVHQDR